MKSTFFSIGALSIAALASSCQSIVVDEIAAGNRASYQRACSNAGFIQGTADFDSCMNLLASTSERNLPDNASVSTSSP